MEIRHLIYFKTVAEELHFGRAAERLFMSQPPLSRQIKDLEDELGVILFFRTNKRVELTEAGKYFLEEVVEILQNIEHSKTITKQIHNNISGEFKLGYISSTPKKMLATVLKQIQLKFPYLRVSLFETSTQKQKLALENGKLDLGIMRAPIYSSELLTTPLFEDPMVIVGHSQVKFNAINFFNESFISFNQKYASEYHRLVINTCNRMGFEPKIVHQSNSMSSILELVSQGLGLAVVPSSTIKQYPHLNLKMMKLEDMDSKTEVILVSNIKSKNSALGEFIACIQKEYLDFNAS
ncbi:LysR family transcriptional regulator [Sphingobacterium multivorum]|jgi:DNA-binding transcriptional LysR family regulator|uniref:LysR family transcriptional regulator n=2 Tax=Sphingobacterium TaxID=28453 RepID=A0ABX7CZD4_SPHMU|nr:LysR family transcriptional regulator [Sphingobacterium multivorum]QQT56286.1 LysR family transcriptional regulator [Sphingobacterium multivorum]